MADVTDLEKQEIVADLHAARLAVRRAGDLLTRVGRHGSAANTRTVDRLLGRSVIDVSSVQSTPTRVLHATPCTDPACDLPETHSHVGPIESDETVVVHGGRVELADPGT